MGFFEDPEKLKDELLKYFSDRNQFQYGRTLQGGAAGNCITFRRSSNGQTREIVVKVPNDDDEYVIDAIKNEHERLWLLRHADHIVRLLVLSPDPLKGSQNGMTAFPAFYIIMEYLPNGTLERLIEKLRNQDTAIPNRVLWGIFLCLVRASVAMGFPPEGEGQREEIRPGQDPSPFAHRDLHGRNLVFGDTDGSAEHDLFPILKLIDFDNATDMGEVEDFDRDDYDRFDRPYGFERLRSPGQRSHGADQNVFDIGQVMSELLTLTQYSDPEERAARCRQNVRRLPKDFDRSLRELVLRCLAVNPRNRPTLEELLNATKAAVLRETPEAVPATSNQEITNFVQRFFYDASLESRGDTEG
ncbi:kinase-like domain-containing protein [Xylariomycetidae sp. FL0641]|nr:kinase-like domain-containing protein [Xylariomycetidae sp. FL0641]